MEGGTTSFPWLGGGQGCKREVQDKPQASAEQQEERGGRGVSDGWRGKCGEGTKGSRQWIQESEVQDRG